MSLMEAVFPPAGSLMIQTFFPAPGLQNAELCQR